MIDPEVGQAKRRWRLISQTCAAMLFMAACAPLTSPTVEGDSKGGPHTVMVTTSESSAVEVLQAEGQTVLDVTSESGIGNAVVTWTVQNADPFLLRLRLSGLEEFRFAYGSTEVLGSVSSRGDHQVRQSVATAGGAQETITSSSPYWLTIEPKTSTGEPAASIPLQDGYFDVKPPAHFADGLLDEFRFSWIDFYR